MLLPESVVFRNKDKRIAIIYSVDDLFEFIVEIHCQGNSYFIGKAKQPDKFGNLEDATTASRDHKVEEAYLALSKTYQETDSTTDYPNRSSSRYDYQKVPL